MEFVRDMQRMYAKAVQEKAKLKEAAPSLARAAPNPNLETNQNSDREDRITNNRKGGSHIYM